MQLSNAVLQALSALEYTPAGVRITEQLDRKLYVQVNEALEAAGGKWNKKAKVHTFAEAGASGRIDEIIVAGEVTTEREERQRLGFFATPPGLARELVRAAGVEPGHVCLEPSAGDGALVRPMLDFGATVLCIERDEGRRKALLDLACVSSCVVASFIDDFMDFPHPGVATALPQVFDRVVMNPPFVKSGLGDHIDHVMHAFDLLTPGGTLATILPISVTFRRDARHTRFRVWYADGRHELTVLPEDAFAESGTRVRTCMLKVQK